MFFPFSFRRCESEKKILCYYHIAFWQFNKEFRKDIEGFSEAAEAHLVYYDWPGNVRELKNTIERAVILGNEEIITPELLSPEIRGQELIDSIYKLPKEEVEKQLIKQALDMTEWNQSSAAKSRCSAIPNEEARVLK